MHFDIPNFGDQADTMGAVFMGALLATLGGFIAARLEARLRRDERERDAALLLGELAFSVGMVLKMAGEARAIGDPYGSITMGMLRGALREVDAYERIRERLGDLRDSQLRIRLHTLMLTVSMSLAGMLDVSDRIESGRLFGSGLEDARRRRDSSFDFIIDRLTDIDPLIAKLGKVARVSFERHESLVRS